MKLSLVMLSWLFASATENHPWNHDRNLTRGGKKKKKKTNSAIDSFGQDWNLPAVDEACGRNPRPSDGAFEVIARSHMFDSLEATLTRTGLDDVLQEEGPFTIFAPSDSAFLNIEKEGVIERLIREDFRDHLTDLVLHHVVPQQESCYDDFRNSQWIRMANLERARVRLNRRGQISLRPFPDDYDWSETNQLSVVFPDIPAKNGVIHSINRVFLTRWIFQNLYSSLVYNDFFAFVDLVSHVGLQGLLEDEESLYTLLVPSNDVLLNTPMNVLACIVNEPGVMEDLVRFHILQGVHTSSFISNGDNPLTSIYNDETVVLTVSPGSRVTVNNGQANVISANTFAYNGVIHEIDSLLVYPGFPCENPLIDPVPTSSPVVATLSPTVSSMLASEGCDHLHRPRENIFELVQLDNRLDRLEHALASTLTNTALERGVFTLFGPTDAAFMNMDPTKPGIADRLFQADFAFHLKDLLNHHIIAGVEMCIDDLYHAQQLDLNNGDQAKVKINKNGVFLRPFPEDYRFSPTNQLAIVFEDQSASNGVLHLINRVFLTNWIYKTLFDVLGGSDDYTTLTSLIVAAGLEETLRDEDTTLTILAPTNAAFLSVDTPALTCLLDNVDQLTSLLSYHVSPQIIHTGFIREEGNVQVGTVQGNSLMISVEGETVVVNGKATVIEPNMLAFNGIVHGIDAVLYLSSALCLTTS